MLPIRITGRCPAALLLLSFVACGGGLPPTTADLFVDQTSADAGPDFTLGPVDGNLSEDLLTGADGSLHLVDQSVDSVLPPAIDSFVEPVDLAPTASDTTVDSSADISPVDILPSPDLLPPPDLVAPADLSADLIMPTDMPVTACALMNSQAAGNYQFYLMSALAAGSPAEDYFDPSAFYNATLEANGKITIFNTKKGDQIFDPATYNGITSSIQCSPSGLTISHVRPDGDSITMIFVATPITVTGGIGGGGSGGGYLGFASYLGP